MKTILKTALIVLSTSVATMAMMPEMNPERDNALGTVQLRTFTQVVSNPASGFNFQEITHNVQQLQRQQQSRQKIIDAFSEAQAPVGLPSSNPQMSLWAMQQSVQADYDYVKGLLDQVYVSFPNLAPVAMPFPAGGMPGMPAHMMPGMPGMGNPMDHLNPDQRSLLGLVESAKALSTPGMEINVTFNFKK